MKLAAMNMATAKLPGQALKADIAGKMSEATFAGLLGEKGQTGQPLTPNLRPMTRPDDMSLPRVEQKEGKGQQGKNESEAATADPIRPKPADELLKAIAPAKADEPATKPMPPVADSAVSSPERKSEADVKTEAEAKFAPSTMPDQSEPNLIKLARSAPVADAVIDKLPEAVASPTSAPAGAPTNADDPDLREMSQAVPATVPEGQRELTKNVPDQVEPAVTAVVPAVQVAMASVAAQAEPIKLGQVLSAPNQVEPLQSQAVQGGAGRADAVRAMPINGAPSPEISKAAALPLTASRNELPGPVYSPERPKMVQAQTAQTDSNKPVNHTVSQPPSMNTVLPRMAAEPMSMAGAKTAQPAQPAQMVNAVPDVIIQQAQSPMMQVIAEIEANAGTIRSAVAAPSVSQGVVVHKLSVDLYPAHLGKVTVNIAKTAAGMTATIIAETPAAATALAQEANSVMQVLRAAGVTEVTISSGGQMFASGQQGAAANGQGGNAGQSAHHDNGGPDGRTERPSDDDLSDGAVRHSDSPARAGLVI